ncbi:hypothetical protein OHR68_43295 [Spirillospora sp. NBC_00431]
MTDEKPSSLTAAFAELGDAIEHGLNSLGEAVAGKVPFTAGKALTALLDGDEGAARRAIDGLDAEQLRATWRAAHSLVLMTDGLLRTRTRGEGG